MAARRGGLGKGLDGLFPIYNTPEEHVKPKAAVSTKGKSAAGGNKKAPSAKGKTAREEKPAWEEKNVREEVPENGIVTVRLSMVEPNREQPRRAFDEASLRELADSISQFGVLQPLVVKKKGSRYEIIAGERRWRAARLAGLKEIPVVIRDLSPREVLEVSLVENIQREDLNPIEEAMAYQRLLDEFSLTQEEAAARVAKSRTAVTNSLRLLRLDPQLQQMVTDEVLTAGHARALLALTDPEMQKEAARIVAEQSLSVRETEKLVKNFGKPVKKKAPVKEDAAMALVYKEMEERLKASLGTKVHLNRVNDKKGKIEIEYYSQESLNALLEKHLQTQLGRDIRLVVEEDTTLPGAAAAALLNLG